MKPYTPRINLLFCTIGILIPAFVFAQHGSEKEVFIVKPYEPVLSDAVKMNFIPKVTDTIKITPSFNYSIQSRKIPTDFTVVPITAAKMVAEPVPRLYKSYLKMGIGNYLTPLLELNINSLRSSKYTMGGYFRHLSSQWKPDHYKNKEVDAGYADNDASIYGQHFFKNITLSGDIDFSASRVHYYGYNPMLDTALNKSNIQQDIIHWGASAGLASRVADSSKLNYDLSVGYHYTTLKENHFEHAFNSLALFRKVINGNSLALSAGLDYYKLSGNIDSVYHALFQIKPEYSRRSSEWRFMLGLNLYADIVGGKTNFKPYPHGLLEFIAIGKILIPYFGLTGYVETNDYYKILQENPYIQPDLSVKNTYHGVEAYGGLKGNLGSKFAYNLKLNYSSLQNMYFFVNLAKGSDSLGNQFGVVYDNPDLLQYTGEFSYSVQDRIYFRFTGTYNQYTMSKLAKPWHKDIFDLAFSGSYNLKDKIIAGAEIYYIGKRYSQALDGKGVIELKGIVDANLSLEYRYTKMLSAFLRLNNIAAASYYRWNQYPSQRFSLMIGFTYAL